MTARAIPGGAMLVTCLLLALSCDRSRAPAQDEDVSTLDETPPKGMVNGSQVPPERVLAGFWSPAGHFGDGAHGRRILQDGSVWFYREQRPTALPAEAASRSARPQRAWWFHGERLSPREVRQLQDAIRTLGLLDLPLEPPGGPVEMLDANPSVWTVAVPERRRNEIQWIGRDDHPALARFDRLFERALSNAEARWLRDRGQPHAPIQPLPAP